MDEIKIKEIADHFGYDSQYRQAIEEMAELTVALNKWSRLQNIPKGLFFDEFARSRAESIMNIIEEIADVEIMLNQIIYLLNIKKADVDMFVGKKLDRQISRIKQIKEGKC